MENFKQLLCRQISLLVKKRKTNSVHFPLQRLLLFSFIYLSFLSYSQAQNLLGTSIAETSARDVFSVRKVISSYAGNAMEVQRFSDNVTSNIGFDANGDLDTVALKAFCGTVNCGVRTWYSQRNARNIAQTNTALQPLIMSGGIIYKQGERPSLFIQNRYFTAFNAGSESTPGTGTFVGVLQGAGTGTPQFVIGNGTSKFFRYNTTFAQLKINSASKATANPHSLASMAEIGSRIHAFAFRYASTNNANKKFYINGQANTVPFAGQASGSFTQLVTMFRYFTAATARIGEAFILTAAASATDAEDLAISQLTYFYNYQPSIDVSASALTAAEDGGTATFTVKLGTRPIDGLVLDVVSSIAAEGTVSPASLTFTSSNWETEQTVTVTGVNDDIDRTDSTIITLSYASTNDAKSIEYRDVIGESEVTFTDDDTAGITVGSSVTSIPEDGSTTATFTVVLTSEPSLGTVSVDITADSMDAAASSTSLDFTSGNWDTPQTVTVTALADDIDDGNIGVTFTATVAMGSTSTEYTTAISGTTAIITTIDDDTAGITVTGVTATAVEGGADGSFTVVLTSEPSSGDVTVDVATVSGEATASPTSLTFTSTDWNTARTVTVTATNDLVADGDIDVTFTATVAMGSASAEYPTTISGTTAIITTIDDDTAGITVGSSVMSIQEDGSTTATFTVVLTSEPSLGTVSVDITADSMDAAASSTSLDFTSGNWDTPQTVTVTALADDIDDGNIGVTFTATVAMGSTSTEYTTAISGTTAIITTIDDDTAGITVGSSVMSIQEDGSTTATFTVVLTSEPSLGTVSVDITADSMDAAASSTSLDFTSGNWDTPQTVTVTALADDIDDGNIGVTFTATVAMGSTSTEYTTAISGTTAIITTIDDDTAGITVTGATATAVEGGADGSFTVVLTSKPSSGDVTVDVATVSGEATASPISLMFTSTDWNIARTVTVTATNDLVADGDLVATFTATVVSGSTSTEYTTTISGTTDITAEDDDVAGITVTGVTATAVEGGADGSFTVVLTSEPSSGDVTVDVATMSGEATASPTSLTFTSTDWNTARTVTVTAMDDLVVDGDIDVTFTATVAMGSTSTEYTTAISGTTVITAVDNDAVGITISDRLVTDIPEAGGTGTFTVVLNTNPTANVVLSVVSGTIAEGTVVSPLTFTSANWSMAQTVTVTGVNDDVDRAGDNTVVTVSVETGSSATEYGGVPSQMETATFVDDDVAGITVTGVTATAVEGGADGSFTVVLDTEPSLGDVTVDVTTMSGEATASPTSLTFTSVNWNTARTVTVTATDDLVADGDLVATFTAMVASGSTSTEYIASLSGMTDITAEDDDVAGITVTGVTATAVEGGADGSFTVVLDTKPSSGDVTVDVATMSGEATASPISLTFTSTDWNTAQTVTVTATDDLVADGDLVATFTATVASGSTSTEYTTTISGTTDITAEDDDTAGITVTGVTATAVEGGADGSFTVVLTSKPSSGDVTVDVATVSGEATASPTSLMFTSTDWNTAQTVTVTAMDDLVVDGDLVATFIATVASGSTSTEYIASLSGMTDITAVDNDVASISLNSLVATVSEDGTTTTQTIEVTLGAPPTDVVVLDIAPSNGEVAVSETQLTFAMGEVGPKTFIITGVVDNVVRDDTDDVVVSVNTSGTMDASYASVSSSTVMVTITDDDKLTVNFDNDMYTVAEDGGNLTGNIVVIGAEIVTEETVEIMISDASAAGGADFTATTLAITIPVADYATATNVSFNVPITEDNLLEGDETFTLELVNPSSNVDLGTTITTATATITDNETLTVAFSSDATAVGEGDGNATVELTISGAEVVASNPVSVMITYADGTATGGGVDYTGTPTTFAIPDGDYSTASTATVMVAINPDQNLEQAEDFTMTLSSDEVTLGAETVNTVTIADDDVLTVEFATASTNVSESDGTVDITLNVSGAITSADATVTIAYTDGTATGGTDYDNTAISTVTIPTGSYASTVPIIFSVPITSDEVDESNETFIITISSMDATVGTQSTHEVTIEDDDMAGIIVDPTVGINVIEGAASGATFTVVLTAAPTGTVVVDVTSSDATQADVVGATSLTFDVNNWNIAQTVSVVAIDDANQDNAQVVTFTAEVNSTSTTAAEYVTPTAISGTTSVTAEDNDVANFIASVSAITLDESGAMNTAVITLSLTTTPLQDVVVDITTLPSTEVTLDQTQFTFAANVAPVDQTFTVTAIDDNVIRDDTEMLTLSLTSTDIAYGVLPGRTVAVTIADDDNLTITLDAATYTLSESGGSITGNVNVSGAITEVDMTAILSLTDVTTTGGVDYDNSGFPMTIDITTGDYTMGTDFPFSIMVTDDNLVEGTETFDLVLSYTSPKIIDGANAEAVVTIEDNDILTAAFTTTTSSILEDIGTVSVEITASGTEITTPSVLMISYMAGTATEGIDYTVSTTNVTIPVGDYSMTPWIGNVVIPITVDMVVEGDETFTLTMSENDLQLSLGANIMHEVTITNDDMLTVEFVETTSTVGESDGNSTVVLSIGGAEITSDVTVDIAYTDGTATQGTDYVASPTAITIVAGDYTTATTQDVVVAITADRVDEVDEDFTMTLTSSDITIGTKATHQSTITDDDTAAVTVSLTDLTIAEDVGTGTFTVVLTSEPVSDVVLTVASNNTDEATVDVATLTFTTTDWETPQIVTVTGVNDDDILDDMATVTVAVDVPNTTDANYAALSNQDIMITLTDDDMGYTVSETELTIAEDGATATFTVVLNGIPTSDVVFMVSSDAISEALVDVSTLTFTAGDWNIPQTVTVTAVNDDIDIDDIANITVAVDGAMSDDNYDALASSVLQVTLTDDDVAGFTVDPTTLTIDEDGGTGTFTVVLSSEPLSDVTVSLSSSDVTEATVSLASLTFTSADWNTPQMVTVTGVNDEDDRDGDQAMVTLETSGSDATYTVLSDEIVTINLTDDDEQLDVKSTGVLSLNGDGINDRLAFAGLSITKYPENKVTILNRWGNIVWEVSGYDILVDEKSFVGVANKNSIGGGTLPSGTYYYIVDKGNGESSVTGFFEIIK